MAWNAEALNQPMVAPHEAAPVAIAVDANPDPTNVLEINPAMARLQNLEPRSRPWSSGLFDCFSDIGTCVVSIMCWCVPIGQLAQRVNPGKALCLCKVITSFVFVLWLVPVAICYYLFMYPPDWLTPDNANLVSYLPSAGYIVPIFILTGIRHKIRVAHSISGDGCDDCGPSFCCFSCAVSQVLRHVLTNGGSGPHSAYDFCSETACPVRHGPGAV